MPSRPFFNPTPISQTPSSAQRAARAEPGSATNNRPGRADLRLSFAHRGGAGLWPENTLLAFENSISLGVSHIESDVHATRDGHLVLFHDARLERTTNGRGFVRDHTLRELKQLDAGYRFRLSGAYPFRGQGLQIPTLNEALDCFPEIRLNLELKQAAPSIVGLAWQLIKHRRAQDQILIAAADDRLVREFREISGGEVATSAGTQECLRFILSAPLGPLSRAYQRRFPLGYDALQIPPKLSGLALVTERFVRHAHQLGLQVHVWTIDNPEEMIRLWRIGVDGIMTDRPDRLIECGRG